MSGTSQAAQIAELTAENAALRLQIAELEAALANTRQASTSQTEEALRKLSCAVEQSPVSVAIIERTGTIEYVNPRFTQITGYHAEEVIGQNARLFILSQTQQDDYVRLWNTITAGDTWQGTFCGQKKNGDLYWKRASIAPITSNGGTITHVVAIEEDITEQRHAEETLRISEEKFYKAFHTSLDAINIIRLRDGQYIDINDGFTQMTGYTWADVSSGSSLDLGLWVEPTDQAKLVQAIRERGEIQDLECHFRRKDGAIGICLLSAKTIEIGGERCILSVTRDITGRKQAEDALRESEARFRATFENASIGVCLTSLDGRLLRVNEALCAMLGFTRTELEHMTVNDITYPADQTISTIAIQRLAVGELDQVSFDKRYVHQQGHVIWAHISSALIPDAQFQPAYFITHIQDITERKQAEESRRESEQKFRTVIEQFADGLTLIDEQGAIVEWNKACERLSGLKRDELIGKPWWDIQFQLTTPERRSPERFEYFKTTVSEALRTGRSDLFDRALEATIVNLDGSRRIIQQTVFPIKTEKGYWLGSVTHDITARKQTEETLRRSESAEHEQRLLAEALRDTAAALTSTLDPELVMIRILENLERVVPYEAAEIFLVEEDTIRIAYCRGWSPQDEETLRAFHFPLDTHNFQEMISSGAPLVIADTSEYANWLKVTPSLRSYIGAPVRAHNTVIGFLSLNSTQPGFFTAAQAERLRVFADQAAIAIENAQLYDALRRYTQQLETRVEQRTLELRQAKEQVEAILNSSSDGIILADIEEGIQQTNVTFSALFACSPYDYLYAPLTSLAVPDEVSRLKEALVATTTMHTIHRIEILAQRKDGTTFNAELGIAPISSNTITPNAVVCVLRDVTDRQQAQQALAEERNFLQILIDAIPDFIYVKDREHRFVLGNMVLAYSHNKNTLDKLIGKTDFDFFTTEIAESFYAAEEAIFQTGTPLIDKEECVPGQDSSVMWLLTTKVPLRNLNGEIIGLVGSSRDITLLKNSEEALRQSQERLRESQQMLQTVLDAIPVGVFWKDRALLYRGCNRLVAQDAGLKSTEDIVGKSDYELPWHALATEYQADDKHLIESGHTRTQIEEELTVADGSSIWFQANKMPLRNSKGDIIGIVGAYVNITDRKRAEDALRESEARFRHYFELPLIGMALILPDRRWLQVNDKLCEMVGYRRDELIGKTFVEMTYPDDLPNNVAMFDGVATGEREGYSLDKRYIRKDGQLIYVSTTVRGVRNPDGHINYVVALIEDITERKRLEVELRQALDKEKELNELKTRFVSLVSHEFRTPLTAIQTASDLLQHYSDRLTDHQKAGRLTVIQNQVHHMTKLLDQVLTVSRAERGKLEFNPTPLHLKEYCQDILDTLQTTISTHQFVFSWAGMGDTPNLDKELLLHILTNLLTNAVKYSPEGSHVYLDVVCQPEQVVLKVTDEGIGIPPADQAHLFEPFHRARNVGQIPGTGLGLTIVKQMVERHGGSISYETGLDSGTTFTVVIPITR